MRDWNPLIAQISDWDGVTAGPHRFGGVEFTWGAIEIGHLHLGPGLVDVPFTRRLREALVQAQEAEPHHLLADSGWISFWAKTDADVEQARRLLRLSYAQKRSRRDKVFAQSLDSELESLAFPDTVRIALNRPVENATSDET